MIKRLLKHKGSAEESEREREGKRKMNRDEAEGEEKPVPWNALTLMKAGFCMSLQSRRLK